MLQIRFLATGTALACSLFPGSAQSGNPVNAAGILARVSESTVLILTGEGAGRLSSIGTGVVVRPDGVILTSHHVIKDAREVQIRLKNGEVYDRVELIGFDERRDVAALKISARNLRFLSNASSDTIKPGAPAFAVTNADGLRWSAAQGIFAAVRPAEEVNGAGTGYRVIQFTAALAPGASGGPVVDADANVVGIITRGVRPGATFAVPIESVMGLADGTQRMVLGSGASLQLPSPNASPSSAAVSSAKPQDILRNAKTCVVASRTTFFSRESLERSLLKHQKFAGLGLQIVQDKRVADLVIEINRPLFTYQFTFSVTDPKTSLVLESGKVTAIDGETAAGLLAKELVARFSKVRQPAPESKPGQ